MRLALQMSVEGFGQSAGTDSLPPPPPHAAASSTAPLAPAAPAAPAAPGGGLDVSAEVDNEFMRQLLQSVDVDINDPAFQAALSSSTSSSASGGKREEEEPKNKKSKQ